MNIVDYKKGSPERTFAFFCLYWKNKKWRQMLMNCQITWRDGMVIPENWLIDYFGNINLIESKIRYVDSVSPVFVTIHSDIKISVEEYVSYRRLEINIIKEDGVRNPSEKGDWGVNPVSALKMTVISEDEYGS